MRTFALGLALVLAPAIATASHGHSPATGVATVGGVPVPVVVHLEELCAGATDVAVAPVAPGLPAPASFEAEAEILADTDGIPCLWTWYHDGLRGPGAFRLTNPERGVDLVGVAAVSVHYALTYRVAGTIDGGPAEFGMTAYTRV